MEQPEETQGTKRKRESTIGTDKEEERDGFSELPDIVLLQAMKDMDAREAVQTCILSKRWKDLWKSLTTLSFNRYPHFRRIESFKKFVCKVLSKRDGSISLENLHFGACGNGKIASELMNRVVKYAVLHNVQKLTIGTNLNLRHEHIFSCQSLTFLELKNSDRSLDLPKSLKLPKLKTLIMFNVRFTASYNGCADPFSTCNLLTSLSLRECSLRNKAKTLVISNSNLLSLNLDTFRADTGTVGPYHRKIVFSTPNLRSLTIRDLMRASYHQHSSTCDLQFLEEGTIDSSASNNYSEIAGRLQLLTNVKILTVGLYILKIILKDLPNLVKTRTQPPCFVRLEKMRVKWSECVIISIPEANRAVEYLLQNSNAPEFYDVI